MTSCSVMGAAGGGKLLCFISFDLAGRAGTDRDTSGHQVIFGYSIIWYLGHMLLYSFPDFSYCIDLT